MVNSTLHNTRCTTPYTLHSAQYAVHSTLHSTRCTIHGAPYTVLAFCAMTQKPQADFTPGHIALPQGKCKENYFQFPLILGILLVINITNAKCGVAGPGGAASQSS